MKHFRAIAHYTVIAEYVVEAETAEEAEQKIIDYDTDVKEDIIGHLEGTLDIKHMEEE